MKENVTNVFMIIVKKFKLKIRLTLVSQNGSSSHTPLDLHLSNHLIYKLIDNDNTTIHIFDSIIIDLDEQDTIDDIINTKGS